MTILDQVEIVFLLNRLARAQDDRDTHAYAACLDDRIVVELGTVTGFGVRNFTAEDYTSTAIRLLSRWELTEHHLFNHVVSVDGDTATCECDFRALHVLRGDGGTAGNVAIGGRYHMQFRRADPWRMTHRKLSVRYQVGDDWVKDRLATLFSLDA